MAAESSSGYTKLYLKEPVMLTSLQPYLQKMPKVASRFALRPSPPAILQDQGATHSWACVVELKGPASRCSDVIRV